MISVGIRWDQQRRCELQHDLSLKRTPPNKRSPQRVTSGAVFAQLVPARWNSCYTLRHQLLFEADAVFLHLLVERRAVDSQRVGGSLAVPAVRFQGIENQLSFWCGQR